MNHKRVAQLLIQILEQMQPDNARKVVELVCNDLYGTGLFEDRITHDGAVWMELTKMNPDSEVLEKAGDPSIEAYYWSREF